MKKIDLFAIRKLFRLLMDTPLHPQWLSYRDRGLKSWLRSIRQGTTVLDIGCHQRWPEAVLQAKCSYIGLDYPSVSADGYISSVDVWGDAHNLPVASGSVGAVLLLDVFEHLRDGQLVLKEVHRVLEKDGKVLMQVPFMYPVHDSPMDFRRLTIEGLTAAAEQAGLNVIKSDFRGSPLETSCLLLNIAIAKLCARRFEKNRWIALFLLLIVGPFVVPLNIVGWLASRFESRDAMMPFSYQVELEKIKVRVSNATFL